VYDIFARTLYRKLEAHSGFGKSLDDPAQVAEKNLAPTPPSVYRLKLQEKPSHGVKALRLAPENEQKRD
jgi:type VI secretion system (T6SS) effector TldE1-like protein